VGLTIEMLNSVVMEHTEG